MYICIYAGAPGPCDSQSPSLSGSVGAQVDAWVQFHCVCFLLNLIIVPVDVLFIYVWMPGSRHKRGGGYC